MDQVTKAQLVELIETGQVDLYLGTFMVAGETRAFYRSYKGAADEAPGFKIIYVVI